MVSLTLSLFFSGMVMPLAFFPDWLRTLAHALPFAVDHADADRHLARQAPRRRARVGVLALQAFWALVLLGLGRVTLSAGRKKLVVQGG